MRSDEEVSSDDDDDQKENENESADVQIDYALEQAFKEEQEYQEEESNSEEEVIVEKTQEDIKLEKVKKTSLKL